MKSKAMLSLPLARSALRDRTSLGLLVIFLLVSLTYLWRAALAVPLALHGSHSAPYNELADAFLHFRLWVGHLSARPHGHEPLQPWLRPAVLTRYADFAMSNDYLYLTWGPAPVLVWLVPLHMLGFEPSESVIILPFAIAGLGFSLAALRVIIRQLGGVSWWIAMLAALTLAYCSTAPYLVLRTSVYYEAVAAGYCFTMAGAWLALSAIEAGRPSLLRLALTSLCFGLATASRPTLGVTVVVLVAVYASLRSARQVRGWIVALALPVTACFALLAGYDQARFGNPLQYGTEDQLNYLYHTSYWGSLSYVPVALWSYLVTPPHLSILFPFLYITTPELTYPLSLPAHYLAFSEETGGLLAMSPIVLFLVALPWIWRRRPALLGSLTGPLLAMAGAGIACLLLLSYELISTTERYEGDYTSLVLLGAVAAWLALSSAPSVRRRKLIAAIGGILATWGCLTGLAVGGERLQNDGVLHTATDIGSPISTAIATLVGHPVLAEVYTPDEAGTIETSTNLETNVTSFWLTARDQAAEVVIVSPDEREVALAGRMVVGPAIGRGVQPDFVLDGPGQAARVLRAPLQEGELDIPVHLGQGVNRLVLSLKREHTYTTTVSEPLSNAVLIVSELHILDA